MYLKITFLFPQAARGNRFGFGSGDIQGGERLFGLQENAGSRSRDRVYTGGHRSEAFLVWVSNKNSEHEDLSHFEVKYDPSTNQIISFGHLWWWEVKAVTQLMPLNSHYSKHLLNVSSKPVCKWYQSGGLQRFAVHESSGLGRVNALCYRQPNYQSQAWKRPLILFDWQCWKILERYCGHEDCVQKLEEF